MDNDLADAIVTELVPLGLVPDLAAFERVFIRIVESFAPTAPRAWDIFYRNTIAGLRANDRTDAPGSVAAFGRIYARIASLIEGDSVLDVGSCFGFLPLLLAEQLPDALIIGSDLSPATVSLAGRMARGMSSRAQFLLADGTRLPFANRAIDTVTVVHLLEHLPPRQGERALQEAMRAADRRVLVAVPLEEVPNRAFGHVRRFTVAGLAALGAATGWGYRVWAGDGGWLMLDRNQLTGARWPVGGTTDEDALSAPAVTRGQGRPVAPAPRR